MDNQAIKRLKNEKFLPIKAAHGIKVSNPKATKFSISPKIHKPVIRSTECHISEISRFLDYHFQSIVKELLSYIKDTNRLIS